MSDDLTFLLDAIHGPDAALPGNGTYKEDEVPCPEKVTKRQSPASEARSTAGRSGRRVQRSIASRLASQPRKKGHLR
jgi:hypothetical protein